MKNQQSQKLNQYNSKLWTRISPKSAELAVGGGETQAEREKKIIRYLKTWKTRI